MSTTNIDEERLQQYFDGELSAQEAAAVREEIATSEDAAQALAKLERLHTMMQGASEEWTGAIDSDALFARIERGIASEDALQNDGNGAVTGDEADAPSGPALKVIKGGGERRVWGGVAVGLAAAAAVFLAFFASPGDDSKEIVTPDSPKIASAHLGSQVLEVDFGGNTGTVFEVQGAIGQPLAVVWIDDEEVGLP